jgi:hypothetical protein
MADPASPEPQGSPDATEPDTQVDPAELAKRAEKAEAELERWKADARKHEDRAKQNADAAKRLRDLERSSMDETQKAVATAKDEAEAAAAKRWGQQLVNAEVKAAAAHLTPDQQAAIAEAIDPSRFLTADGEVDTAAIETWVGRAYPAPVDDGEQRPPGFPDVAQGARGGPVVPQPGSGLVELINNALGQ